MTVKGPVEGARSAGRWLRAHAAIALAGLLLTGSMLVFDRPLIRGDAVAYFMWTASFGQDFDMDLQNQAEHFGALNTYMALPNPATGRYATVFAWGQGLILLPAFWAARVLDQFAFMRVNDDWFLALQAYPFAYSLLGMLEVNLLSLASLLMAYGAARRLGSGQAPAAAASLAVVWGTPLYHYSTVQPLYSHASATFAHTLGPYLFILCWTDERVPPWRWLVTGLAFGLATLTRWQLAASLAILCALLATRRQWRAILWLGLGWALLAWHVPYTFNWMFGSPTAVPMEAVEGQSGFLGLPQYLGPVLFSGSRGLFVWSPIAVLSVIGLYFLGRQHPALTAAFLLIAAVQVIVISGVRDWYGGESFGMRRLTELYPILAVSLAALLTWAGAAWRLSGVGGRALAALAYATTTGAALYGLALVVAYLVFVYFTDPAQGYVAAPPPSTALNIWQFFLNPPKLDLIWPLMEHHFGVWAWTWPGP